LRYRRGEIHLINTVSPAVFEKLSGEDASLVRDAGATPDTEQLWFNQVPTAPIPAYKRAWFASTAFRRAVSEAINSDDLVRTAYRGRAHAAIGITSPSNLFWFNSELKPHPYDPAGALQRLRQDGFTLDDSSGVLRDRSGHPVEFSIITNASSRTR